MRHPRPSSSPSAAPAAVRPARGAGGQARHGVHAGGRAGRRSAGRDRARGVRGDARADPHVDREVVRVRAAALAFNPITGDSPRGPTHFDVFVPADQARRGGCRLAAGGRLADDSHAPAWWSLASPDNHGVDIAPDRHLRLIFFFFFFFFFCPRSCWYTEPGPTALAGTASRPTAGPGLHRPDPTEPPTRRHDRRSVRRLVPRAAHNGPVVLVGHSYGGSSSRTPRSGAAT